MASSEKWDNEIDIFNAKNDASHNYRITFQVYIALNTATRTPKCLTITGFMNEALTAPKILVQKTECIFTCKTETAGNININR